MLNILLYICILLYIEHNNKFFTNMQAGNLACTIILGNFILTILIRNRSCLMYWYYHISTFQFENLRLSNKIHQKSQECYNNCKITVLVVFLISIISLFKSSTIKSFCSTISKVLNFIILIYCVHIMKGTFEGWQNVGFSHGTLFISSGHWVSP